MLFAIGQEKWLINQVGREEFAVKSLIVVCSYHHKNTQKVAEVMAKVLDSQVKSPQETGSDELKEYDLIGFIAGIDSGKHYRELLAFADALSQVTDKKAFIFSTCGAPMKFMQLDKTEFTKYVAKNHSSLREKLQPKGYLIVDEFSFAGFNTNSFNKRFGGIIKALLSAHNFVIYAQYCKITLN
jgi:flavodoxin